MVRSDAATVEDYMADLPEDRREFVVAIRDVIVAHLPEGYEEAMNWGMLSYQVPLERYPNTYNGQPLSYVALASQKHYVSLYLMHVYGHPETEEWFHERYRASGKTLDMGKSCVRFRAVEDVPLDLVGEVIARYSVDDFLARYEASRAD